MTWTQTCGLRADRWTRNFLLWHVKLLVVGAAGTFLDFLAVEQPDRHLRGLLHMLLRLLSVQLSLIRICDAEAAKLAFH